MRVQDLEPGATYKAEVEFTVDPNWPPDGRQRPYTRDTKGMYRVLTSYDKIEKVRDRFVPGALYLSQSGGKVYRRTGYDPPIGPKWAFAGGGYVPAEEVNEARLVRLYREGEGNG